MDHMRQYFKNWGYHVNYSVWHALFNIFFITFLFFIEWWIRLDGYSLIFHGCRGLRRNQFSFHQKYLCYLEYFQERNGLLGVSFSNFWLKDGYSQKSYSQKCFLVTEMKPINIGINSFKTECNECNIYFVLLWTLKYINVVFPYHVERNCK